MDEKPLTNEELILKARSELAENRFDPETVRLLIENLRCAEIKIKMIGDLYEADRMDK